MKTKRFIAIFALACMVLTLLPLSASAQTLSDGRVGESYNASLYNGNMDMGTTPTFSTSGDIPPGLKIKQSAFVASVTYSISGTPTKAGTYHFTFNCRFGTTSYSNNYTITIDESCTNHTYGDVTYYSEPTCTKEGKATGTCTKCGKKSIYTVPALGHDMSFWALTQRGGSADTRYGEIWESRYCMRTGCNHAEYRKLYPLEGEDYSSLLKIMKPAVVADAYDEIVLTTEGTLRNVKFTGYMPDGMTVERTSADASSYSLRGTPTTEGDYFFVIEAERDGIDLKFPVYITVYKKGSIINDVITLPEGIQGQIYERSGYFIQENVKFSELGLSNTPDGGFYPDGMELWDWWDNLDDFDGHIDIAWLLEGKATDEGYYYFYYSFTGDDFRTYVFPMEITITEHQCLFTKWTALNDSAYCTTPITYTGECSGDCAKTITASASGTHTFGAWTSTADGFERECVICGEVEAMDAVSYDCYYHAPEGETCFTPFAIISNDGDYATVVCELCGSRQRFAVNAPQLAGLKLSTGFVSGRYLGGEYNDIFNMSGIEGMPTEVRRALPDAEVSEDEYSSVLYLADTENITNISVVDGTVPAGLKLAFGRREPWSEKRLYLTGRATEEGSFLFTTKVDYADGTSLLIPARLNVVADGEAKLQTPYITMQPRSTTAQPGEYVTLSVRAKKVMGVDCSYTWYRTASADSEGESLTGMPTANTDQLTISIIEYGTWYYYCVVTYNVEGGGTSSNKSVVVSVSVVNGG